MPVVCIDNFGGCQRAAPSMPLPSRFYRESAFSDDAWNWAIENSGIAIKAAKDRLGHWRYRMMIPDDVASIALTTAALSHARWDSRLDSLRTTYAYKCVSNEFADNNRKDRIYPCPSSVVKKRFIGKSAPLLFGNWTPKQVPQNRREQCPPRELCESLWDAFMKLDSRRRMVMFRWLGIGGPQKTIDSIRNELGVSKERLSQLIESSIESLRKSLGLRCSRPIRPLPRLACQVKQEVASYPTPPLLPTVPRSTCSPTSLPMA
jgi:hypothetical protein